MPVDIKTFFSICHLFVSLFNITRSRQTPIWTDGHYCEQQGHTLFLVTKRNRGHTSFSVTNRHQGHACFLGLSFIESTPALPGLTDTKATPQKPPIPLRLTGIEATPLFMWPTSIKAMFLFGKFTTLFSKTPRTSITKSLNGTSVTTPTLTHT